MDPDQSERTVRSAYDELADSYADRFASTEPEQPVELAVLQHFASRIGGEHRVLDAGCGAGRLLPVLDRWVGSVEGVDLSAEMVRRARHDHPQFPTCVASLTALPHPDAVLDGYVSWYSTVHAPDSVLPVILGEARRVLRDGGLVAVGFQSTGSGPERVQDVSPAYRAFGHDVTLVRHVCSVDAMARALAAAGFHEVARLEREPVSAYEADHQAVLVARR